MMLNLNNYISAKDAKRIANQKQEAKYEKQLLENRSYIYNRIEIDSNLSKFSSTCYLDDDEIGSRVSKTLTKELKKDGYIVKTERIFGDIKIMISWR